MVVIVFIGLISIMCRTILVFFFFFFSFPYLGSVAGSTAQLLLTLSPAPLALYLILLSVRGKIQIVPQLSHSVSYLISWNLFLARLQLSPVIYDNYSIVRHVFGSESKASERTTLFHFKRLVFNSKCISSWL